MVSPSPRRRLGCMVNLRLYLDFAMRRVLNFVERQQLLVPVVFGVAVAVWQWKTVGFQFHSLDGICRSLWPYLLAVTFFWCLICFGAGSDLNRLLEQKQNYQPLYISDKDLTARRRIVWTGRIIAMAFSAIGIVIFAFVTYEGLLWVQPWESRAWMPPSPDISIPQSGAQSGQQANDSLAGIPRLLFSDSPLFTPERKEHIEKTIDDFRHYLKGVGFDVSMPVPPIRIQPGKVTLMIRATPDTAYDDSLAIGKETIDDPMILREAYANYYFSRALRPVETADHRNVPLVYVYSSYFVDSYPGGQRFPTSSQTDISRWIKALRDLRKQFGTETTDKALCIGLQRLSQRDWRDANFKSDNDYISNVIKLGFETLVNDFSESEKIDTVLRKYRLMSENRGL